MPPSDPLRWLPRIFLLIGLPSLLAAFLLWRNTHALLSTSTRVDGVVTSLVRSGRGAKPVVTFHTPSGAEHTLTGRVSSRPPAYAVGERVQVAYPPDHPESARLVGFLELYFLPFVFASLGSVFTLFATLFLIFMRPDAFSPRDPTARAERLARLKHQLEQHRP